MPKKRVFRHARVLAATVAAFVTAPLLVELLRPISNAVAERHSKILKFAAAAKA